MAEVARHNKKDDCWVVVDGHVLDVTQFIKQNPGGEQAILFQHHAGKDVTNELDEIGVVPGVVESYLKGSEPGVTVKGPLANQGSSPTRAPVSAPVSSPTNAAAEAARALPRGRRRALRRRT